MTVRDHAVRLAYRDMLRVARRTVRNEGEARDLVQDAIVIALERGLTDWTSPEHRPWLHGVLRKRAAFVIRTAQRRRRREQASPQERAQPRTWAFRSEFVGALPRSLRLVALLVSSDLSGMEVRWLLDLSPTAFRARLSALRQRVRSESHAVKHEGLPPLFWGPRRAPILKQLKSLPNRTMASHDPDGHVLFFRSAPHKIWAAGNSSTSRRSPCKKNSESVM